jgi:hypothetical protein
MYYYSGCGIGDAVRIAAELWARHGNTGCTLAVQTVPYDGAAQLFENLDFISVIRTVHGVTDGVNFSANPCPEERLSQGLEPVTRLHLPSETFKVPCPDVALPPHFIAVQTETGFNKRRVLRYRAFDLPVVLLGWERSVVWPEALDLRGRFSIAQNMAILNKATAVVGVESWMPLLGAVLGKLVWQELSENTARTVMQHWQKQYPTMAFQVNPEWPI